MKIKSLIAGLLLSAVAANASVTMSGAALLNQDVTGYSTGVFVSSNSGSFTESLMNDLVAGISLTAGTTIGDYTILGTGAVNNAGPSGYVVMAGVTYNLGGNVATNNEIGVLVFQNSTTSTIGGDAYSIYTNDWLAPADGANSPLTGAGPYTGAAFGTSTVVPEPSAYALLGGLFALGCVMLRRRV
jgi:hypothetical protein